MARITFKKIVVVSLVELLIVAVALVLFNFVYSQKGSQLLSKPSTAFKTPQKGIVANIINDSPIIISGEGTFILFGKVKNVSEKNSIVTVTYTDQSFLPVWLNSQSMVYRIKNEKKEIIKANQIKTNDTITLKALYNFKENTWMAQDPINVQ